MALPGAGLLALLAAAQGGAGAQQQLPQRRQPGRVRWGGQQFGNLADLMAWITAHGGNAQQTLASHPGIGAAFGQRGAGAGGGALAGGIGAGASPLLGGGVAVRPHVRRRPRSLAQQMGPF